MKHYKDGRPNNFTMLIEQPAMILFQFYFPAVLIPNNLTRL